MSETWDQEPTKMAPKKRACSKPELYRDFTVCAQLQHSSLNVYPSGGLLVVVYLLYVYRNVLLQQWETSFDAKQHNTSVGPGVKLKVRLFWDRRNVVETKILLLM